MNTFLQVLVTAALAAAASVGISSTDFGANLGTNVQAGVDAAANTFDEIAADVNADLGVSAGADLSEEQSAAIEADAGAEVGVDAEVDASIEDDDGSLLDLDLGNLLGGLDLDLDD